MTVNTTGSARRTKNPGVRHIRLRLQHERSSRLAQLGAIEADPADGNEELVTAQTTTIRRVLAEIDAAEARLKNDTYGDCTECGRPIPVERLEILPYAKQCVVCQQNAG